MGNIFSNNTTQEDGSLSNKPQQLEKENKSLTNGLKRKRESSDIEDKVLDQEHATKRVKHDSRSDSKLVITFSGFKSHAEYYTKSMKKEICALVKELALDKFISIVDDNTEDRETLPPGITHIIVSPSARTMKVLQAIVTQKWIMSPEWILQLRYLPNLQFTTASSLFEILENSQARFGFVCFDNFLQNKNVYLSESFVSAYRHTPTWKHCVTLIECAKSSFVDDISNADFCLIGSNSSDSSSHENPNASSSSDIVSEAPANCYLSAWAPFIDLIYPPYREASLAKGYVLLSQMKSADESDNVENT